MARTHQIIPSTNFQRFFSVRKVQQMYPNLTTTRQAEKLKNYFCNTTLHYVAILQGYLKPYSYTIDDAIQHIIQELTRQQQQNYSHSEFYYNFITELNDYKELHDDNTLDEDYDALHSYLETLYNYVHDRYHTD